MHIRHLSLTNFRNYGRLELDIPSGATLLHGYNAQGKTNLLEAIYYLATTRSPHAEQDQQLLNWDAVQQAEPVIVGRLVATVMTPEGERLLELRLIREDNRRQVSFRREALVNRRKVRLMDLLGNLRVVLFLPEDMQLLTDAPHQRRRYLDITLCQIDPIYCRNLSKYNKVLEQRNALLRQLAEGQKAWDLLTIFDEKMVTLGSHILIRRATFWEAMAREAQRIHYEALTEGTESMRLHYWPRLESHGVGREEETTTAAEVWLQTHKDNVTLVMQRLMKAVTAVRTEDVARGSSSIGPHRDDWRIWVNGRDLGSYGSRGQQRSAILALKLAEINWMSAATGDTPILLLDEVVAELDERRRSLLLDYVKQAPQALLTATDPGMFTAEFLTHATRMAVANGRIQVEPIDTHK